MLILVDFFKKNKYDPVKLDLEKKINDAENNIPDTTTMDKIFEKKV